MKSKEEIELDHNYRAMKNLYYREWLKSPDGVAWEKLKKRAVLAVEIVGFGFIGICLLRILWKALSQW